MVLEEVMVVVVVACVVVALLVGALGWRRFDSGPAWDAAIFVFLIVYPALWVAKIWIRPAGPRILGVYWAPLLLVGLIVASIIGSVFPAKRRRKEIVIGPDNALRKAARKPFGFFFWFLMLLYLGALISGHGNG